MFVSLKGVHSEHKIIDLPVRSNLSDATLLILKESIDRNRNKQLKYLRVRSHGPDMAYLVEFSLLHSDKWGNPYMLSADIPENFVCTCSQLPCLTLCKNSAREVGKHAVSTDYSMYK